MAHARRLLKKADLDATVEVVYFLVIPEGGTHHQWKMPAGWDRTTKINDHRGDVFCVRVPVSVHGASCLFTSNFATELSDGWA